MSIPFRAQQSEFAEICQLVLAGGTGRNAWTSILQLGSHWKGFQFYMGPVYFILNAPHLFRLAILNCQLVCLVCIVCSNVYTAHIAGNDVRHKYVHMYHFGCREHHYLLLVMYTYLYCMYQKYRHVLIMYLCPPFPRPEQSEDRGRYCCGARA